MWRFGRQIEVEIEFSMSSSAAVILSSTENLSIQVDRRCDSHLKVPIDCRIPSDQTLTMALVAARS